MTERVMCAVLKWNATKSARDVPCDHVAVRTLADGMPVCQYHPTGQRSTSRNAKGQRGNPSVRVMAEEVRQLRQLRAALEAILAVTDTPKSLPPGMVWNIHEIARHALSGLPPEGPQP